MLDAFSRRVVGWSMATTLATQLVLDALNMALATRRPKRVNQGSQYASFAFGHRCREAGVRPSMGSVGDAYEGFYNPRRRHSSIGYASPVNYEQQYHRPASIPAHRSLLPCRARQGRFAPPPAVACGDP
jgi:putative transposase